MNCFEGIHSPLDRLHVKAYNRTHEWLRTGVFNRSTVRRYGGLVREERPPFEAFSWYLSSAEVYSARNLRFDSDILHAFRGILRHVSSQKPTLGSVWGL